MTKSTISKAYQTIVKRLCASSRFFSGSGTDTFDSEHACTTKFFWNKVQPAITRIDDNKLALTLIYDSRIRYRSSICDSTKDSTEIKCFINENASLMQKMAWIDNTQCVTLRKCKGLISKDDFKRIWLTTALNAHRDLYKLGHAGKPFIKANDTIESLAIEYDLMQQHNRAA